MLLNIPMEVIALIVSLASVLISVWTAISTAKQTKYARAQYNLALEQHNETRLSEIFLYLKDEKYVIKYAQLAIRLVNVGNVPVTNLNFVVKTAGGKAILPNQVFSYIRPKEEEEISIGQWILEYLRDCNVVRQTEEGFFDLKYDAPFAFIIGLEWCPSARSQLPQKKHSFSQELTLSLSSKVPSGRDSVFFVELGGIE